MGYFSNGTEAELYKERWCYNCIHWGPDTDNAEPGCAVMDLHWLYVGEDDKQALLDHLIPRAVDGPGNARCRMFIVDTA